jgi:hypothetical protein
VCRAGNLAAIIKFPAEELDGFFANYADNDICLWNNGDSIAGK